MVIYQFMFEGFLQLKPLAHTSACYLVFKAFKRILDSLKHLRTDRGTYAEAQAQIKELMTFTFTDNLPLRLHLRNWVWLHLKSTERITPSETGPHYCQQVYSPNLTNMPDFDQDLQIFRQSCGSHSLKPLPPDPSVPSYPSTSTFPARIARWL